MVKQYQDTVSKNLDALMTKGRAIFLAYDQGLEHGPTDFNDKNYNPQYIIDIAEKAKCNAVILHKGAAEKYYDKTKNKVPLIVKLNGKTNLIKGEPRSPQVCSVDYAISLGAKAIGYTIYLGSDKQTEIFAEFARIQEEAHKNGLPVIVWMYPRGAAIKNEYAKDTLAYAARVAFELGADIVKIKYPGKKDDFTWAVQNAGKMKVVVAGGKKTAKTIDFLRMVEDFMHCGASGIAVGRNVWQHRSPEKLVHAIKGVIFEQKNATEAMQHLI